MARSDAKVQRERALRNMRCIMKTSLGLNDYGASNTHIEARCMRACREVLKWLPRQDYVDFAEKDELPVSVDDALRNHNIGRELKPGVPAPEPAHG